MSIEKIGGRSVRVIQPENKASIEQDRNTVITEHKEIEKLLPTVSEKFDALIEGVDMETLWRVFVEHAHKSGVSEEMLNKDAFTTLCLGKLRDREKAHYATRANAVVFDVGAIDDIDAIDFLLLLVHEMVHATARVDIFEWSDGVMGVQAGYAISSFSHGFNEGVTERLAQEVCAAYMQQTGQDIAVLKERISKMHERQFLYSIFMSHVGEIARRIDEYAGLQSGTAWKAIIRGAYSGDLLRDPEISDLLRETFSEDFLERYERIGYESTSEELVTFDMDYDMRPLHMDARALDDWLAYLGLLEEYEKETPRITST